VDENRQFDYEYADGNYCNRDEHGNTRNTMSTENLEEIMNTSTNGIDNGRDGWYNMQTDHSGNSQKAGNRNQVNLCMVTNNLGYEYVERQPYNMKE
jgi:hypothetical protein